MFRKKRDVELNVAKKPENNAISSEEDRSLCAI
jgi:hypothetical protein